MTNSCCATCSKSEGDATKLLRCSICHKSYCSRDCQAKDFATHKPSCKEHGVRELLQAISDNDAAKVRRLAKTKYVLNGRVDYAVPTDDEEGDEDHVLAKWTALHQCIRKKRCDLLRILCAAPGVKVDIKDGDGETPLFVAAANSDDIDILKVLISSGANVNAMSGDGWTALMMAARDGYYDHAELLLKAGADVYLGRDMFGRTCMDLVASQATGQMGLRLRDRNETMEEAKARHMHMLSMLERYA